MSTPRPLILLASRICAPEPAAASFRLSALADALAAADADVRVLTVRDRNRAEARRHDARARARGIDVRRAPVLRDASGYVRGYVQYMSFDLPLALRLLVGRRPAAVIAEPPPTTGAVVRAVCALRRVPYVYYAADIWSDAAESSASGVVVSVLRAVERAVVRGAARTIAVSEGVAERVRELGGTRIDIVPNGVSTDTFRPDGPVRGSRCFVYAGTSSEWQGAEVFAEAMRTVVRHHPDVSLVYLGQGSAADEIARIASELPEGAIVSHGVVPPEEAAAWQRGAIASVVSIRPGLGYDFAMPTKVYAGLASGAPVVYAGPGPLREPIRDESLGWVTEHDPEAVAEAMLAAVEAADAAAGDPAHADAERRRRHAWVVDHHSLLATGRAAARTVLSAVRRGRSA